MQEFGWFSFNWELQKELVTMGTNLVQMTKWFEFAVFLPHVQTFRIESVHIFPTSVV